MYVYIYVPVYMYIYRYLVSLSGGRGDARRFARCRYVMGAFRPLGATARESAHFSGN